MSRGPKASGDWIYPTTRWAIYLRDGCACVYCGVTMAELLADNGENFLSLDHWKPRKRKGGNEAANLVTACYDCNTAKGTRSVQAFARDTGLSYGALLCRSRRRRLQRDVEHYRSAAKILLGLTPWATIHDTVRDHDFLALARWSPGSLDVQHWRHLRSQAELFCSTCGHAHDAAREHIPF